jgi:hypothetical protein
MDLHIRTDRTIPDSKSARVQTCRRGLRPAALALVLLGAFLALAAVPGLAKEKKPPSKTVSGVVFDSSGQTIDGAAVQLTDLQTGKVLDIYSQEGGQYQFTDLSFDHDYKIKAMYKGATSEERQVSSLDMRARPVMNLTIPKAK